ncbi:MAG: hypothetical protein OHK0052_15720 [Anaerolineales bacterium]
MLTPADLQTTNDLLETYSPQQIILWAVERFSARIAASSSFQTQSLPLLHILHQIAPTLPIFFLDTGMHFWETLIFREELERTLHLNVIDIRPDERWHEYLREHGRDLPLQDPNLCCYLRKVQPMQRATSGLAAWITGIRRDQTAHRAQARILEPQPNGLLKINPMLNWTKQDIEAYITRHNLPRHPLEARGYRSIGCLPCTAPVALNQDDRAGRWQGRGKTECGLHTEMFSAPHPPGARE